MSATRKDLENSAPPLGLGYLAAVGATVLCTLVALAMESRFDPVNIAMVYLLAVVGVALYCSRGAAVLCAALCVAAFGFFFVPPTRTMAVDDMQYLLTFAIMLAVALLISKLTASIRAHAEKSTALHVAAETERVRSALLASISHDLRTPLAVMCGASSTLAEEAERLSREEFQALAKSIADQAQDLSEHVTKILQMTRLEGDSIRLQSDWNALDEIVGAALARLKYKLARHQVVVDLPSDLPLLRVDATLIEQVLGNLLENAAKYTPAGTLIRLRAHADAARILIHVEDFGGTLRSDDFESIFAKFHRGAGEGAPVGAGLGLSICRAIVSLHGGNIWVERLPGGATSFRFSLPLRPVPVVPVEPT